MDLWRCLWDIVSFILRWEDSPYTGDSVRLLESWTVYGEGNQPAFTLLCLLVVMPRDQLLQAWAALTSLSLEVYAEPFSSDVCHSALSHQQAEEDRHA